MEEEVKYQVGDWVCLIDSEHDDLKKVTEVDVGAYYMKYWRHATPEEIKAGQRL